MPQIDYIPTLLPDDVQYESGWTVSDLVDHTYFLCDEARGDVFKESACIRLINMAMRDIYSELGYPYAYATYVVYIGADKFNLVDLHIEPNGGGDITYMQLFDGDNNLIKNLTQTDVPTGKKESGEPTTFYVDGETIVLDTIPEKAYKIKVRYRHMPKMLELTDNVPVPHGNQQLACQYAAAQFKLKDDQIQNYDRLMASWTRGLDEIRTWETGVTSYVTESQRRS